jgi:molybdenum cofactor guanylyltransferase
VNEDAPLAAVVLAGGASRRLGRDKAAVRFRGPAGETTFVEHVVSTLRSRCGAVFVIAAPGQHLPDLDAVVLRDEARGVGPLLATARGLRAAADAGYPWAFVSAVDMPQLTVDLVDELARVGERVGAEIVLPWDGRDHYLAGIYRTALAGRADDLVAAGRRSMASLAGVADTQRMVMDQRRELLNVNTSADLANVVTANT